MKYLVTGGTGFIGSALVKGLLEKGHNVKVFDNNSRGNNRRLSEVKNHFEFIEGDIRNYEEVNKACKGIDSVCHLAYINGTEFFYSKPDLILEVGIKGMMNILDASLSNGVSEFVLASSSEVYQRADVIPTPETVPLIVPDINNPRYSYGGGKIACELLAMNYGRKHFEKVSIFRPHNVYGPDMGWEHVLPQFILRMHELVSNANQKEIIDFQIQGSGNETRSFINIEDFTDGLILVLEKGVKNNIYHIGTEEEITIRKLAEYVADFFNVKINIVPGQIQKGGTDRRCPDVSKLKSLGFEQKVSLSEGISKMSEWYVNNKSLKK